MTTDTIKLIDGRTLEGRYDDTWSGRDYGTGSLRRVRFINVRWRGAHPPRYLDE